MVVYAGGVRGARGELGRIRAGQGGLVKRERRLGGFLEQEDLQRGWR